MSIIPLRLSKSYHFLTHLFCPNYDCKKPKREDQDCKKQEKKGNVAFGTETSPGQSILKFPVHDMDIFIIKKKVHDSYIHIVTSVGCRVYNYSREGIVLSSRHLYMSIIPLEECGIFGTNTTHRASP